MEDFTKREYTLNAGSLLVLGTGYLVEGDLTPVREIKTGEDGDFFVVVYGKRNDTPPIGTDTASFTIYRAEKKTTVKTTEGRSWHIVLGTDYPPDEVRMIKAWDDWDCVDYGRERRRFWKEVLGLQDI